jgi:hypothetical protein
MSQGSKSAQGKCKTLSQKKPKKQKNKNPSQKRLVECSGCKRTCLANVRPQCCQKKKKLKNNQMLVAHTCNPSYSGGRDQEDCDSKPAWANSSQDPISKKLTPRGLVEWLKM